MTYHVSSGTFIFYLLTRIHGATDQCIFIKDVMLPTYAVLRYVDSSSLHVGSAATGSRLNLLARRNAITKERNDTSGKVDPAV